MVVCVGSLVMANSPGMEGVRAYLRELRLGQKVSHQRLASLVGMGRRTIIDWETGQTKELKLGNAVRIAKVLGGSSDDIIELIDKDASEEDGRKLAERYIGQAAFQQIEQLSDDGKQDVIETIRAMQEDLDRLKRRVGLSGE